MAIGFGGEAQPFGMPRRKGLFGKPWEAPGTPGIGDGVAQPEQPMMSAIRAPMEPQAKPGLGTRLFGKGWEDKAFALGGMLRGDPTGAYMMRQEKQREQDALAQAAAEQRKRAEDLADFRTKEGIKAEYSRPAIEDNYDFIMRTAGPEAANRYVNTYGQKPDEPRMVSIPGRGSFFGTMDEVQAWLRGGPQTSQVDPSLWDQGEPIGGPTQPASGGFRR